MSTLASPTLLRWYIPGELKALREQLGLTQAQVAARLRRDRSYVAQLERGRNLPSAADLEVMLIFFGMERRIPTMLRLLDAAKESKDWFETFEGAAPPWFNLLLAMERVADTITDYVTTVPGLAQTRRYSEALIRYLEPHLTDEEVRWRVDLRTSRQQILNREDPPAVHWVLEEAMLRHRRFGDEIMREQIAHLGHLSRRPNITMQVMPTVRGPHEGINGSFMLLDLPDLPRAPSVVYGDGALEGTYFHEPSEVRHFRTLFSRISAGAWSVEESAEVLDLALQDLS